MRFRVRFPGLAQDSESLWLWHRPVASAPIRSLAWEPPYAVGAAQEMAKRQKKKKKQIALKIRLQVTSAR